MWLCRAGAASPRGVLYPDLVCVSCKSRSRFNLPGCRFLTWLCVLCRSSCRFNLRDLGPWPDSGFPIKAGTWFRTWLWVSCRRWCRFYLQKFHCFYHIQVIHNTDAFPVWLLSLVVFSVFIHVVTCISISFIYFIVPKFTNIYYSNHFKIYSFLGLITFTLLYNHTLNNHVQSIPIFTSKLCSH